MERTRGGYHFANESCSTTREGKVTREVESTKGEVKTSWESQRKGSIRVAVLEMRADEIPRFRTVAPHSRLVHRRTVPILHDLHALSF